MNSVRLIVNPISGRGRGARVAEQVSRILRDRGLQHELCLSQSPADPTELTREAVRDRATLVVGIGGDGLINQIANELVGSETTLGIIPVGVGNDIARGLGIPLGIEDACAVVAQGHPRRVDVGQVNERYFFSVAVMGLAAQVNRRANQFQRIRVSALYSALTVASVLLDMPRAFTVQYDGQTRRCYSWLIAVANTWSCGRGMALVPAARADDGMLDACIVNGMGKVELLYTFPRVFRGRHIYHTGIETLRGRTMTISADSACDLYADGEHIGPLPVVFTAIPQALKVMAPLM
ncbi:MAG: diacylglycerol kinase family lipid kinase [Deltaproteobacteria bacterium]|nr:diacylglycerol kinase family lipid kinase [Deltaproteobacteria bacterium]